MYLPDKEAFQREADQGCLVPVFRELPADLETPISAFLKLGRVSPCFLLESVEMGERLGRYSFIGTNPYMTLRTSRDEGIICRNGETSRVPLGTSTNGPDALDLVRQLLTQPKVAKIPGLPRFFGGAVGYVSYDVVHSFERLSDCSRDELQLPESIFLFTDTLVIFDHIQHVIKVV